MLQYLHFNKHVLILISCLKTVTRSLIANLSAANCYKSEHLKKPENWALGNANRSLEHLYEFPPSLDSNTVHLAVSTLDTMVLIMFCLELLCLSGCPLCSENDKHRFFYGDKHHWMVSLAHKSPTLIISLGVIYVLL